MPAFGAGRPLTPMVEQAQRLAQQNAITEARQLCLEVLELAPGHPDALTLLYQICRNHAYDSAMDALVKNAKGCTTSFDDLGGGHFASSSSTSPGPSTRQSSRSFWTSLPAIRCKYLHCASSTLFAYFLLCYLACLPHFR